MNRRGNAYDNVQAESCMKTPKMEGAYPMACETFAEVAAGFPRFIEACTTRRPHSALGYRSPARLEDRHARATARTAA